MNKFEYKVVSLGALCNMADDSSSFRNFGLERLNDLGDEGWEVCAVDGNKYLLKRKIY